MSDRAPSPAVRVWRLPLLVWAGLLGLTATSVGIAFLIHGPAQPLANLAISAVQAGLIATILMRLDRASALVRLTAAAAFLWLLFMFVLAGGDYFTRAS